MRNQPNIRTDWDVDDIFKPANANALTDHIPYDYIVTAADILRVGDTTNYTFDLYEACGTPTPVNVSADGKLGISILISVGARAGIYADGKYWYMKVINPISKFFAAGTSNVTLDIYFAGHSSNDKPGGVFSDSISVVFDNREDPANTAVKFHNSGTSNAIQFTGSPNFVKDGDLYVGYIVDGSFYHDDTYQPGAGNAKIYYEHADTIRGVVPSEQFAWMSNGVGGAIDTVVDFGTESVEFIWGEGGAIGFTSAFSSAPPSEIIAKIDAILSAGMTPVAKFICNFDNNSAWSPPAGRGDTPCTVYATFAGIRCGGFYFVDPVRMGERTFAQFADTFSAVDNANRFIYVGTQNQGGTVSPYISRKVWREI